jgi:hypothetical protein
MTYDKKSSTIKVTSDDPKELERDMFAHFANVMEQVERDRANETLPSKRQQSQQPMDPRAGLREALLASYQPKEMFGQECFFCGKTGSLMSPNLLEYYHDSKYKKNVGLVPTSESRGRVRGYMPICTSCAQRCNKCGLPIRTKWVERMAEQVRTRASHLTVVFGQGYCRHMHPVLNLSSYLKPIIRLGGTALAPEEYEEAPAVQHAALSESTMDRFIFAMAALGSPRDPNNLQKIGADVMAKYPDPYIAALEATKIIVDGVVIQSGTDHGLMAHLMQNNCMGVVSLYLDGKVAEDRARDYFRHFNELPRRALGLRPEATARLPTFEKTIEMVQAKRGRR